MVPVQLLYRSCGAEIEIQTVVFMRSCYSSNTVDGGNHADQQSIFPVSVAILKS